MPLFADALGRYVRRQDPPRCLSAVGLGVRHPATRADGGGPDPRPGQPRPDHGLGGLGEDRHRVGVPARRARAGGRSRADSRRSADEIGPPPTRRRPRRRRRTRGRWPRSRAPPAGPSPASPISPSTRRDRDVLGRDDDVPRLARRHRLDGVLVGVGNTALGPPRRAVPGLSHAGRARRWCIRARSSRARRRSRPGRSCSPDVVRRRRRHGRRQRRSSTAARSSSTTRGSAPTSTCRPAWCCRARHRGGGRVPRRRRRGDTRRAHRRRRRSSPRAPSSSPTSPAGATVLGVPARARAAGTLR